MGTWSRSEKGTRAQGRLGRVSQAGRTALCWRADQCDRVLRDRRFGRFRHRPHPVRRARRSRERFRLRRVARAKNARASAEPAFRGLAPLRCALRSRGHACRPERGRASAARARGRARRGVHWCWPSGSAPRARVAAIAAATTSTALLSRGRGDPQRLAIRSSVLRWPRARACQTHGGADGGAVEAMLEATPCSRSATRRRPDETWR